MFGIWRTLLALEVAAYHLAGLPLIGEYAVFSFFALSGFLMTAIMERTYGYTVPGRLRFFANRLLRLMPNYWFALALAVLLILALGQTYMMDYHAAMRLPDSPRGWAQNLTMLFVDFIPARQIPRLIPPSWALTTEWIYYAAIAFGLGATSRRAAGWLALSMLAVVTIFIVTPTSGLLYGSIFAGSLAFAAGAWTYHHQARLRAALAPLARMTIPALLLGQIAAFLLPFAAKHLLGLYFDPVGNWCNIALSCLLIAALNHDAKALSPRLRQLDKALGAFSYPIYLLHYPMGALASYLLFGHPLKGASPEGLVSFALALLLVALASLIPVYLIDPAIERRRSRIRSISEAHAPDIGIPSAIMLAER